MNGIGVEPRFEKVPRVAPQPMLHLHARYTPRRSLRGTDRWTPGVNPAWQGQGGQAGGVASVRSHGTTLSWHGGEVDRERKGRFLSRPKLYKHD